MESLLPQINLIPFASIPISKSTSSNSSSPPFPLTCQSFKLGGSRHQVGRFANKLAVDCGKGVGQFANQRENPFKEEGEWAGIEEEWKKGKCGGRKGIVELMECLEREAIMGDDQGTDPADYNRRAQIFDKSSRVFQALKHNQQP